MAAADEANPQSHPDALRRRRTLRDAGLAAKAAGSFPSATNNANSDSSGSGAAAAAAATDNTAAAAGDGGAAMEEGGAPWIGRRVVGAGGRSQVVAPDHSTARLSLGSR